MPVYINTHNTTENNKFLSILCSAFKQLGTMHMLATSIGKP